MYRDPAFLPDCPGQLCHCPVCLSEDPVHPARGSFFTETLNLLEPCCPAWLVLCVGAMAPAPSLHAYCFASDPLLKGKLDFGVEAFAIN